ncbi:MAG: TonB family protein [Alphaproteobacteria bacterium]|nr:TonB family protein [Alphaproteobacteria bacterium]
MSADEDELKPDPKVRSLPKLSEEDTSALSWLGRWIGIPLLIVIALYYLEPLLRGGSDIDVVPSVTRQRVQPYPFPEGATGPSLAPPEIPRPERAPPPVPTAPLAPPDMSSADIVANPISQPQPQYPQRALEAEKEGIVRLRITIGPDGSVIDAQVVSAQPRGWFENAAINAVKRWRYQPSGRTIQTEVEIEFKLN